MTYYETIYPSTMHGAMLDEYLAAGWYRIGQVLSTTDLIDMGYGLMPVFWLRLSLARYRHSRSARRILKANADLSVQIYPFYLTHEIEELYVRYRRAVSHNLPATAHNYLFDEYLTNAFDSRLIEVRHAGRLVAAGVFDLAQHSSAGIMHMFDPEYGQRSLGKLLFLIEVEYSRSVGHEFYYPGYFCTETPKFDYKFFADPDATEVFLRPLNRWLPYAPRAEAVRRWGKRMASVSHALALVESRQRPSFESLSQ
ncbi:MAG: arginine-tRNA-protein transferase [Spirochaetes bacterium]|nr:arginine-tRNA-protein transferase [Spirochaetota bacterium]